MSSSLNSAGIQRVTDRDTNLYYYIPIGPFGITPLYADSTTERPITQVGLFQAFRFANWMANGQPKGVQDNTTTENGTYDIAYLKPGNVKRNTINPNTCLLYTSPSPRDGLLSRMPSSA